MTLEEMCVQVYENLGNSSDLNPYEDDGDFDTSDSNQIRRWVNRGYKKICSWKYPNGAYIRFNMLNKTTYFNFPVISGTASGPGTSNTITLSADSISLLNAYQGWTIKLTGGTGSGQVRRIVYYTPAFTATVEKPWDTVPDIDTEYELYVDRLKFYDSSDDFVSLGIALSLVDEVASPLRVTDLEQGFDLTYRISNDRFPNAWNHLGDPSTWYFDGSSMVFNTAQEDSTKYYLLEYRGYPANLDEGIDIPVIPDTYHDAIVMYATWLGLIRLGESEDAYAMQRNIRTFMDTTIDESDSLYSAFDRRMIAE